MDGIINFFKPRGMTSHQAVNFLRKKLDIRRIGHTGTLDPEVSGVLPLCVGKATRVSEYLLESDKEYICIMTLGKATETYDSQGQVTHESDKSVSDEEIFKVFESYKGEIEQIPPMYSALRHKGRRLYELAREGVEVERKPRLISIYENEILSINGRDISFRIKCSKGSYIRSICHDIGQELGTYGYMSYLIRTKTDVFTIDKSLGMDFLNSMSRDQIKEYILPIDQGALSLEKRQLDYKYYRDLSHGLTVRLDNYETKFIDKPYRIYCGEKFIGIGNFYKEKDAVYLKMKKVLLV